jgi:hypothetical protein
MAIQNVFTISPGGWWDAGSNSAPHNTVTNLRFEVNPNASYPDPKSPSFALQSAYNALPLTGGEIRIHPGTSPYLFDREVYFRRKPCKVVQEYGSVLVHENTHKSSLFRVLCRLLWEDLYAAYDVTDETVANRSLFLFGALDLVLNNGGGAAVITIDTVAKTLTRNEGSFITDGLGIGDYTYTTGFPTHGLDPNNNGPKLITAVTATVATYRQISDPGPTGETGSMYYANGSAHSIVDKGLVKLCQNADAIQHYTVFQCLGANLDFLLPGLLFRDVHLEVQNATRGGAVPIQSTTGWHTFGSNPSGIGFIRAKWCRGLRTRGLDMMGQTNEDNQPQWAGPKNYIDGCLYNSFNDELLYDFDTSAADTTASPAYYSTDVSGTEGGHSEYNNIFLENCGHSHIIEATNPVWLTAHHVRAGRMKGRMTSAFKAVGGKTFDMLFCGTHNCPGPQRTGSVSASAGQFTIGADNFLKSLKAEDRVRAAGWTGANEPNNRIYTVTSVGATSFNVTPSPPVSATETITLSMMAWVADLENVEDSQIVAGNHTFRKSDGPPYRFKNCKDVHRDPNEPIDNMGSQRFS